MSVRVGPLQGFIPAVTPRWQEPRHLRRLTDLFERIAQGSASGSGQRATAARQDRDVVPRDRMALRRRPRLRNAYASYAASLAFTKSRLARDYALAAGVQLREDANKVNEWVTTDGADCSPPASADPDRQPCRRVLLVDDPHKNRAEAESATVREKIKSGGPPPP